MKILLDRQTAISREINDGYIGSVQRVLVDSISDRGGDNVYKARTSTNKLVHFVSDESAVGKFKYVKIDRAGAFDLFGIEMKGNKNDENY